METISALLDLCEGNPVTGEFPHKRPVIWSLNIFFCYPDQVIKQTAEFTRITPNRLVFQVQVFLSLKDTQMLQKNTIFAFSVSSEMISRKGKIIEPGPILSMWINFSPTMDE